MNLKKYLMLGMSATSILLFTACDTDETENGDEETQEEIDDVQLEHVEDSVAEIHSLHSTFVNGLNNLYETEAALQEEFDQTLADDDDLSTLGDGSSPVFENISSRNELLEQLETAESDLLYHVDIVERYEGDDLGGEDLSAHTDSFVPFTEELATYREIYQSSLQTQEEYFNNLSSEEATYDSFIEGIQSVNEEREQLQDQIIVLDDALIAYNEDAEALQSIVNEHVVSEEEAEDDE